MEGKEDKKKWLFVEEVDRIYIIDRFSHLNIERIKNSRKNDSVKEIFVPGEIEYNMHEKQEKEGLFISDGIAGKIHAALEQVGIKTKLSDILF